MYIANPFENEKDMIGEKFVASFSGGKDSMLAIYKCLQKGMIALGMITACPDFSDKSWFHKISQQDLKLVSESINIPLTLIITSGEDYEANFEKELEVAKKNGAKYIVFGDIDIESHLKWCSERCIKVGLKAYFPLWQQEREKVVREFIDSGFKSKIIVTHHENLKEGYLGEILTHELIDKMKLTGIDVCGENGEYHTFVIDGPLFSFPINVENED